MVSGLGVYVKGNLEKLNGKTINIGFEIKQKETKIIVTLPNRIEWEIN